MIQLFTGIDVGTSGVRAVAVTSSGRLVGNAERPLCSLPPHDGLHEQEPKEWWSVLCETTHELVRTLNSVTTAYELKGVAITSTSGTLVLTDAQGYPIRSAILYDDGRGSDIALHLNKQQGQMQVNSSYSLVKAAWVCQHEPKLWNRVRHIMHPADWLTGQLTGQIGVSDHSNSLKLGYDPESSEWSDLVSVVGLPRKHLPRVLRPSDPVDSITWRAAAETGLPAGTTVFAGATDGMASLVASGACRPGHANTTLGTTLVWKALAKQRLANVRGIYSHLHPSGLWAPGAASNSGPGSVQLDGPLAELEPLAGSKIPTRVICYPLPSQGERFPFSDSRAVTFVEGRPEGPVEWYAAQIQSLAFVERWGYDELRQCGAELGDVVFSTGGAAASEVFSQLRADVLQRKVVRGPNASSAFGAAILAAAGGFYQGRVAEAISTMTSAAEEYEPSTTERGERLDEIYATFRRACRDRGYI